MEYSKDDTINVDETALFAFAPPDCGLATQQMSGKKKDKFRITLSFACNASGTEKFPIVFIGRYKQPRCFKRTSPEQLGFYYRYNKTAWMTSVIFEEFVSSLVCAMIKC